MWLDFYKFSHGHGAIKSPPVLPEDRYCYLTFYYALVQDYNGPSSLAAFIEDNSGKKITALWNADEAVYNWKKKVLKLPIRLSSYSVVLLGYTYSFWGRKGYVFIDDIKFWHCSSCKFLCLFVVLFCFHIRYSKLKTNTTPNTSLFLLPRQGSKLTVIRSP